LTKPSSKDRKGVQATVDFIFRVEGYKLVTQRELEESKAEEAYERVLVLENCRRQFYRRMIRFMDKYLKVSGYADSSPFIASQIANSCLESFI
jgi:hypothetical protein